MKDRRHLDAVWLLPEANLTYEQAQLAVLMDIRRQLKILNNLLRCENFLKMPDSLRQIVRNTRKPRMKRK